LGKLNNLASGKVNPPNSSTNLSDPNPSVNGNCIQQCVNAFACDAPVADPTQCIADSGCDALSTFNEITACRAGCSSQANAANNSAACRDNAQRTCQQTCQANNTPF